MRADHDSLRVMRVCAGWYVGGIVATYSLTPFKFQMVGLSDRLARAIDLSREVIGSPLELILHCGAFVLLTAMILAGVRDPRARRGRLLCIVTSAMVLEGLQLGMGRRHGHVMDWCAHAAGAMAGSWLTVRFAPGLDALGEWCRRREGGVHAVVVGAGVMGLLGSLVGPAMWTTSLRTWDPLMDLNFGDEVSGDRAWLGTIRSVAIYDAAISADDVSRCRSGTLPLDHVVWSYDFSKDEVGADFDQKGPFIVRRGGGDVLVDSEGLRFRGPGVVLFQRDFAEETRRMMCAGEVSVAAWVRCSNDVQDGPAAMVTLSASAGTRNFTLGQEGVGFAFRIRDGVTGTNGSRPELISEAAVRVGEWQHVLATYRMGIARLYVDDVERGMNDHRELWHVLEVGGGSIGRLIGPMLAMWPAAVGLGGVWRRKSVARRTTNQVVTLMIACAVGLAVQFVWSGDAIRIESAAMYCVGALACALGVMGLGMVQGREIAG